MEESEDSARDSRRAARAERHRRAHSRRSDPGKPLIAIGWFAIVDGAVCWLFPREVLRLLMNLGIVTDITNQPKGKTLNESVSNLGDTIMAFRTLGRIGDAGPFLVLIGVLLVVGGKILSQRANQASS
jgi:hypothetical protein